MEDAFAWTFHDRAWSTRMLFCTSKGWLILFAIGSELMSTTLCMVLCLQLTDRQRGALTVMVHFTGSSCLWAMLALQWPPDAVTQVDMHCGHMLWLDSHTHGL